MFFIVVRSRTQAALHLRKSMLNRCLQWQSRDKIGDEDMLLSIRESNKRRDRHFRLSLVRRRAAALASSARAAIAKEPSDGRLWRIEGAEVKEMYVDSRMRSDTLWPAWHTFLHDSQTPSLSTNPHV